jgi:hypothetical protein
MIEPRRWLYAVTRKTEHKRRRLLGRHSRAASGLLAQVSVEAATEADAAFIAALKTEAAREDDDAPVSYALPNAYLVVRRGSQRLGCMAVTVMPPAGKVLVEDFFVVPGRWGVVAAHAMIARLRGLRAPKVGFVREGNTTMLGALEAAGMRVTGYIVEVG